MIMTTLPLLSYESFLASYGYASVAGVDEVGRGALAGPLMAGSVILPSIAEIEADLEFWTRVRDSKTLSHKTRLTLAEGITARCRAWATGTVEAPELDQIGVAAANRSAMERAVLGLTDQPDYLLIDATTIDMSIPQTGIIDGDALSLSIAAASIIAKVARDQIMIDMDARWPEYGFAKHKGYAAKTHRDALNRYGPCPAHRYCYAPVAAASHRHD